MHEGYVTGKKYLALSDSQLLTDYLFIVMWTDIH